MAWFKKARKPIRTDHYVIMTNSSGGKLFAKKMEENYAKIRITVERAMRSLPILGRYDDPQMPGERWFLAGPFAGFDYEEVYVNTFNICDGPLVFAVAGGIQPGRWRLIIELEESRVDIPFELYADE